MKYADSRSFFEVSNGPQLGNTLEARLECVKDFFKRILAFPGALLLKLCKTFFRGVGVCFAACLIVITIGSSEAARNYFIERISVFAKDLADWILLPFAIVGRVIRLILALLIHPSFYFNALSE